MTLAVVVPATDRPPTLDLCLAALRRSSAPPDELVVVAEPRGSGPAAARNAGAARTSSELLAFVDADVLVHPDALARLRDAFAGDPGLAAAFGSYDDRPAAPGAVSRFRNLLHHHVHTSSGGPAETFWAGLGAVRRDAFVAVGGFDAERFPAPAVEDVELGMRLRDSGARIVLDPLIRGTHLKRWSLRSMVRADLLARGVPWVRLQLEAGQVSGSLNLAWRHRLGALAAVAALVATLARRPLATGAAAAAFVGINARFFELLRQRGGIALAAAGLPLHLLHQLVSVLSVALGTIAHVRDGGRAPGQR